MAKLVIFGELGSNEVKWQIPNFLKRVKDLDEATFSSVLSYDEIT